MKTGEIWLTLTLSVFAYITVWTFGRPFFEDSELLLLLFPEFPNFVPTVLLITLWVRFCHIF